MAATTPSPDEQDPGAALGTVSAVEASREDAYWRRWHWREGYYEPGFDYEDYAPAFCVGYTGYAQYGGEFEDAQSWLCANWERIKGDSRLPLRDALQAMRSAWQRLAAMHASRSRRRNAPTLRGVSVLHARGEANALNAGPARSQPA
jgi:hypothetical protein